MNWFTKLIRKWLRIDETDEKLYELTGRVDRYVGVRTPKKSLRYDQVERARSRRRKPPHTPSTVNTRG